MNETTKKNKDQRKREEFWKRHISGCRVSGLSYSEYARNHNLKKNTFYYWRKRLSGHTENQTAFVEIKIPTQTERRIQIILRNKIRINIASGVDCAVLKELVGILESV